MIPMDLMADGCKFQQEELDKNRLVLLKFMRALDNVDLSGLLLLSLKGEIM